MQNSAAVMRQHQKYVQDLKPNCRYRKEVNRYEILDVIVEEGFPGLGWWLRAAQQILVYAGFADFNAEFQKLAMKYAELPKVDFRGS